MATESPTSTLKNYLVLFYHFHRNIDFRVEEFVSLCTLYGHCNPFPHGIDKAKNANDPFVTAQLPNEEIAHQICSRAMLTKLRTDPLCQCGSAMIRIADSERFIR